MTFITITILIFLFIIAWWQARSILHPAVITTFLWSTMLIIYNTVDHGLYALSDKMYIAILCWAIPLTLFSLFPLLFPTRQASPSDQDANPIVINTLRPIALAAVIVAMLALLYRGYVYNPGNVFNGIRTASVDTLSGEESLVSFPLYVSISIELASSLLLPFVLYLLFIKEERSTYIKLLTILLVIYVLFRSNKTVIAQYGLAFICIMSIKHKINKKNAVLIIIAFIGIMMAGHLMRRSEDADQFVFSDFITLYLLGSLPAMDSILQYAPGAMIESFNGEYTFRAFLKFIQMYDSSLLGNSDPFNLQNWTYTPIPTNVYTCLFNFYVDFGYIGLLLGGGLYGLIGGIVYKYMRKGNLIAILMYAELFYVFIFQFFIDYGMTFFWTHITILLCILVMVNPSLRKHNT